MKTPGQTAWHHAASAEILRLLDVELRTGLDREQVARRQKEFGPNRVRAPRVTPAWLKFLQQFNQSLVGVLVVASGVTAFLGEWVDSSVIFGVVFVNAIVGFLQEAKAEKAIEALARIVVTETTVRRDGQKQRISSEQLVPGDVVLLQAGDRVPADLRLSQMRGLQVDESTLTGESIPVHKHTDALALETVLADRKNLAIMAAIALAVGAIPEGLPAAVSIVLAIGVARMAKRQAIIRKLPAVETLGSTTVICSDKTGTLTRNQMTVREIFAGGKLYELTGDGYEPKGEIRSHGLVASAAEHPALGECLRTL